MHHLISHNQHESKSNEDYHIENITLDTKGFKCKSRVDSLIELEMSMERLKQALLEWDFSYFMKVGLSGARINPHTLKVGKDVLQEKLVEPFGKMSFCSRFKVCRTLKFNAKS